MSSGAVQSGKSTPGAGPETLPAAAETGNPQGVGGGSGAAENVASRPAWQCRKGITCEHPGAPRAGGVCLGCWPIDPASGRYLCAPAHPMPGGPIQGTWAHTTVVSDGECSEGCCDYFKCKDCGHSWRVEVAQ